MNLWNLGTHCIMHDEYNNSFNDDYDCSVLKGYYSPKTNKSRNFLSNVCNMVPATIRKESDGNGGNANVVSGYRNGRNGYNGGYGKSVGGYRNGGNGVTKSTSDGNMVGSASVGIGKMNGKKDDVTNGRGNKPPNGMNISGGNGASGSRFEVLNEDVEENINKKTLISDIKHQEGNIPNEKIALAEITNANRKQFIKAGKGIKKITKKIDKIGVKKTGNQGAVSLLRGNTSMNGQSQEQFSSGLDNESEAHKNETGKALDPHHKVGREFEGACKAVVEGVLTLGIQNNAEMHIDKFDAVASNLEEAMAAISE
ncbi:hypothetical protein LWI29_020837 [Acer saccharum]|uniref:Uncharacterized protein n=1 Tax=Acer saccharum TaxID=4024 RepID=A0AA39W4B8_ACESA|nr:hypothetical protein LWI29_020837 [Acer saccharum]